MCKQRPQTLNAFVTKTPLIYRTDALFLQTTTKYDKYTFETIYSMP